MPPPPPSSPAPPPPERRQPAPSSPAPVRAALDPTVWKACAAAGARVPAVGDLVYYFPDGHAEQAASPPDFPAAPRASLCRVAAVSLLADADTDEAFARILLHPRSADSGSNGITFHNSAESGGNGTLSGGGGTGTVFFAKVLTPSDANNGGGFSVPRYCADSILPPLDLESDRPVQNLTIKDAHGRPWVFRHIYRGTPRRHLLTTGWSKFVNCKKLVAGDSVVFVRDKNSELYLGVRRTYVTPPIQLRCEEKVGGWFSRGVRGRVPSATVVEAVRLMEQGKPFEVLHYPRTGVADFLVAEEAVEAALAVPWQQGMRIRMKVEAEDSARTTWVQGTVADAAVRDAGPWPRSPWRMLQVRWDDPEVLQNVRYVSPWQVELVSATSYLQTAYPPTKKLRVSESPEPLTDTKGSSFLPLPAFNATNMNIGALTPFLSEYSTYPAGIQGTRQDTFVSTLYNFLPRSTYGKSSGGLRSTSTPQSKKVSTELSIGSASRSQGSSQPSQESIHDNTEFLSAAVHGPRKARECSFQLFGQMIDVKQEIVGDFESKDRIKLIDFGLSYSHKELPAV